MSNIGAIGFALLLSLAAAACGISQTAEPDTVAGLAAQTEGDDRSPEDRSLEDSNLEEKVDTDGDGEMSDEEISAYAQSVLLDFSDCMRQNGYPDFTDVSLEDLTEGSGAGQGRFIALMTERGVSLPDGVPTIQMCGENLSDLQTFAPEPSDDELAEQEAAVLEFAACMRSEGLSNWPDPDFAANGGNGYGPELLQDFDIQSDEVQSAIATCQASNSAAIDVGSETVDGEDLDGRSANGDAGEPDTAEAIDRAPISPLIEGDTSDLNVAEVARRDLIQTKTFAATLGYGELRPFPTNTSGVVTELPDEGDIIGFGEVLFAVDGQPVLLFEGDIPQHRSFDVDMTDGPDVEQLERNLVDLGYADDFDLSVDTDFSYVTADVIEEMQIQLGIDDTGELNLGRIVFSPNPIRVGAVNVQLGQSVTPQVNLVSVTESSQRITLDLDAEDLSLLPADTEVDIELPDGTVVAGRVSDVAAVATRTVDQQGTAGDPTIEITIVFADGEPNEVFDAAPVDIIATEEVNLDVLTVPVPALIALSGGGHAVELIVNGGTQLIGVELGDFVDDHVEIRGDLQAGDRVVMAGS
ncbi:MAG: peptidoglycan-binding protein [Acidimicrobiales bacterium]